MITLETLTQFFGWCTVINIAIYSFTVIAVFVFRGAFTSISTRLFGVNKEIVTQETFVYVARYKLAITVFALVPYVALKLMA